MKYYLLALFLFLSLNLLAQIEYEKDIQTVVSRTAINLSVPDGFNLEKQKKRDGVCYLFFENPEVDITIKYVIWGTRDYMKGLSNKKKKTAKEEKEEKMALLHPNSSYEQTFSLFNMQNNNREIVRHKIIDKDKLSTVYFADWGAVTGIFENEKAKEGEGKYHVGFCLHKNDVANIYIFMNGNDQDKLYEAVGKVIYNISFSEGSK